MILGQGVEHEFNPGGDPQFLENLEQIILDGVLAKLQLLGNLAVRQAVGFFCLLSWVQYFELKKNCDCRNGATYNEVHPESEVLIRP